MLFLLRIVPFLPDRGAWYLRLRHQVINKQSIQHRATGGDGVRDSLTQVGKRVDKKDGHSFAISHSWFHENPFPLPLVTHPREFVFRGQAEHAFPP